MILFSRIASALCVEYSERSTRQWTTRTSSVQPRAIQQIIRVRVEALTSALRMHKVYVNRGRRDGRWAGLLESRAWLIVICPRVWSTGSCPLACEVLATLRWFHFSESPPLLPSAVPPSFSWL